MEGLREEAEDVIEEEDGGFGVGWTGYVWAIWQKMLVVCQGGKKCLYWSLGRLASLHILDCGPLPFLFVVCRNDRGDCATRFAVFV